MSGLCIRPAEERDAVDMARLATQLGYPSEAAQMASRLRRAAGRADMQALLAERDGRILGMVGLLVFPTFVLDSPHGYITTLVTEETARGVGIGCELLKAAEAWFAARGITKVSLTTHLRREQAHRYYERRGYEFNGRRYVKSLG